MDYSDSLHYVLGQALGTLSQLAVITGCIILVNKKKCNATILMLAGSILSLIFSVLSVSGTFIAANQGTDKLLAWTKISAILGPLPYLLFSIGLLWFAMKHIKKEKQSG